MPAHRQAQAASGSRNAPCKSDIRMAKPPRGPIVINTATTHREVVDALAADIHMAVAPERDPECRCAQAVANDPRAPCEARGRRRQRGEHGEVRKEQP
jgi:hypothetical protein